LSILSQEPTSL